MWREIALIMAGGVVFFTAFVNGTWWGRGQVSDRKAVEHVVYAALASFGILLGVAFGPMLTALFTDSLTAVFS